MADRIRLLPEVVANQIAADEGGKPPPPVVKGTRGGRTGTAARVA